MGLQYFEQVFLHIVVVPTIPGRSYVDSYLMNRAGVTRTVLLGAPKGLHPVEKRLVRGVR